jgi:outer membrane autotransporter protein
LGFQYYDLDRTGLGGRTLTADTVGRSVTTALELGRPFTIGPTLTPVVGLDHRTVWMDGCREDGDPVVGLTYTDSTWHETRLRTGMRLLWNHGRATLQVSAFYARLLTGAPESTARFNAQDSRSFSVRGVDRARDAFEPGAALGLQLDDSANANLIVEARGEFSRGVSAGTVRLSLRYRF